MKKLKRNAEFSLLDKMTLLDKMFFSWKYDLFMAIFYDDYIRESRSRFSLVFKVFCIT